MTKQLNSSRPFYCSIEVMSWAELVFNLFFFIGIGQAIGPYA